MARQQHYIPQLYLKGFLDPKSLGKERSRPYLWQVDLQKKEIKRKAPKNVAKAAGFYDYDFSDVSVEDSLQKIESIVAPIIVRFRNRNFDFDEEERFYFSVYLGLQIGRIPSYRESVSAGLYHNVQQQIKSTLGGDDEGIHATPSENFDDYVKGVTLKAGLDYWTKVIYCMNWFFATIPGEIEFITSDNPATLLVSSGMQLNINEYLQLWFPVSPSVGLLGHFAKGPGEDYGYVDAEVALSFNLGVLSAMQRFVFCASRQKAKWALESYQAISE